MFYGEMDNVVGLARQAFSINPTCARANVVLGLGLIFSGRTAGRSAAAATA